jgi:hypothetical protein
VIDAPDRQPARPDSGQRTSRLGAERASADRRPTIVLRDRASSIGGIAVAGSKFACAGDHFLFSYHVPDWIPHHRWVRGGKARTPPSLKKFGGVRVSNVRYFADDLGWLESGLVCSLTAAHVMEPRSGAETMQVVSIIAETVERGITSDAQRIGRDGAHRSAPQSPPRTLRFQVDQRSGHD